MLPGSGRGLAIEAKSAMALSSFSIDVTRRILDILVKNGGTRKTRLARESGLNYNSCKQYLELFLLFGWLEMSSGDFEITFNITETGRRIQRNLGSTSINFHFVPFLTNK